MNIIEHRIKSGTVCPCNYLFDEQIYFPNNKLINEEAPFCYRCKKCDFHCLRNEECHQVKLKLKKCEDEMFDYECSQIEYKKTISNLENNIERLRQYEPLLGQKFIKKIFYLIENAKYHNNIIQRTTSNIAITIKLIIQMNYNDYSRSLYADLIPTQKQILNAICFLNNQLQKILDKKQEKKNVQILQSQIDESLFTINLQELINFRTIECQKEFNKSHEFYERGCALLEKGCKQEALNYFKLDIKPNPYYLKSYIYISEQLRKKQKYDKALKYLIKMEYHIKQKILKEEEIKCYEQKSKLVKQSTEYLQLILEKSIVLKRLRKYEEALICLDEISKLDPKFPRTQIQKGKVLVALQRKHLAIGCFDKELQLDPKNIKAYKTKGVTLSQCGQHNLALQCYEKILEIDEKSQNAFLNKGLILIKLNKQVEAFISFCQLLKLCSNDAGECYKIGNLLQKNKIYVWALKFYDQSIFLNAYNLDYFLSQGQTLQQLNMHQQAIECYDQGLELDPCNSELYARKGISLHLMQNFQKAIRCYNQAIFLSPTCANAHNLKGNVLRDQKKYSEAIQCYDAALYLQPGNPLFLQNKSIAVERLLMQIYAIEDQ